MSTTNPSPEAIAVMEKIGAVCKDLMKLQEKHGIEMSHFLCKSPDFRGIPIPVFLELCEAYGVEPDNAIEPCAWVQLGTVRFHFQCVEVPRQTSSGMDRLRAHLSNEFTTIH